MDAEATNADTNINRFTGFHALARFGAQAGTSFPFSPKWSVVADAAYENRSRPI